MIHLPEHFQGMQQEQGRFMQPGCQQKYTSKLILSSAGRACCYSPGCRTAGLSAGLSHQALRAKQSVPSKRTHRTLLLSRLSSWLEMSHPEALHHKRETWQTLCTTAATKAPMESSRHSSAAHTTSHAGLASDSCCPKHLIRAGPKTAARRTRVPCRSKPYRQSSTIWPRDTGKALHDCCDVVKSPVSHNRREPGTAPPP